jgi:coproporphyrinogen III oxidase-like Fe-S oxidoreductase
LDSTTVDSENSTNSPIIRAYLEALHRQIDTFWNPPLEGGARGGKTPIQTIYFWGGTPSIIGAEEMIKIIDHIAEVYDISGLSELSIEINPEPVDQMLDLIQTISNTYKHLPRVRFSIGIQSLDNEVLQDSGRKYNFQACMDFLRRLVPLKQDHNVFNFDFIAFGKFNTTRKGDRQLRNPSVLDFFQRFVESAFADSFSLYTLELFEGSEWYNQQIPHYSHAREWFGLKKYGSDDDVYEEYEILKEIILNAGYRRYEISNYSHAGKNSIHNRVYRSMGQWLWLGTGATSHIRNSEFWILDSKLIIQKDIAQNATEEDLKFKIQNSKFLHFTTTSSLKEFVAGNYIDDKKTEYLTEQDYLKEKFLMGLRTQEGISFAKEEWIDLLSDTWIEKIEIFAEQWLCERDEEILRLTDSGMDVYNSLLTEIMK